MAAALVNSSVVLVSACYFLCLLIWGLCPWAVTQPEPRQAGCSWPG